MKECPNCKNKVTENNKFCTNCGASLAEVKVEEPKKDEPKKEEVNTQPNVTVTKTPSSGEGLGTASLILGIVSLVLSFTTFLIIPIFLVIITILVGFILGIINLAKGGKKFAGLILNGISIVTGIASFFIIYIFLISFGILSSFDYLKDYTYTTRATTRYQSNPVSGFYKCSSSSSVSKTNYTSSLDLYSTKNFTWTYKDDSNTIVRGTYTYSDVDKDNAPDNTKYYKVSMTSSTITQNGKVLDGSGGKLNVYEMGVDSSGSKRAIVLMNESTSSLYYCVE